MQGLYNHDAWDVAAIFDSDGNVVQWNVLNEEDTGYSEELIEQDTTNSNYQSGTTDQLMLATTDFTGAMMVADWRLQKTELQAVALSFQRNGRHCRWTDPTPLQEFTDRSAGDRSEGDRHVRAHFIRHDANSVRFQNLAHNVQNPIVLPVADVRLTISAQASSSETLTLRALSYDGTELGQATQTGTGRVVVDLVTPPDTWEIAWSTGAAADVALRADGGTNYIAG